MKIVRSFAAALALVVGMSAAAADTVKIKNSHLVYTGKSYFRASGEDVVIGAYGEKRTPVGKPNYLERKAVLPDAALAKLKIIQATVVDIDQIAASKTEIEAQLSGRQVVNTGGKITYEALRDSKLKLVKLTVDSDHLRRDVLNNAPVVLENLKNWGANARIAHQIFVVMEASLAEQFTKGGSFNVSATNGAVTVTAQGQTSTTRTTSITLKPGTTFAYLLLKCTWDKDKKKLADCNDDQHGLN